MLLFLIFLHLIKYSQRNINMFHQDYIFFLLPYISSDFCFTYLCFFVLRCLMVYDVYLLCELYLLSLKIFIFVSFKTKKMKIMSSLKQRKQIYNTVLLTIVTMLYITYPGGLIYLITESLHLLNTLTHFTHSHPNHQSVFCLSEFRIIVGFFGEGS